MSLESIRKVVKVSAIGAGAVAIGAPLYHRENSKRIIGAALRKGVDCTGCIENETTHYPFDAVVVPGGGLEQAENGQWVPSKFAQLRLEAAALSYRDGIAPSIVLLDGVAGCDQDQMANKLFLLRRAQERGIALDESSVIAEDQVSVNTATNMDQLRVIAEKYGLKKVRIESNRFHNTRATLFACHRGVAATYMSCEDTILADDPTRYEEIEALYATEYATYLRRKEAIEIAASFIDPSGRAQTLARKTICKAQDLLRK